MVLGEDNPIKIVHWREDFSAKYKGAKMFAAYGESQLDWQKTLTMIGVVR